jgi:hypothetical protein
MGDKEDGFSLLLEVEEALEAFGLETGVAYGEGFVDDEDFREGVDGDGEGEADEHAAGVGAYGLVDEFADVGVLDDLGFDVLIPFRLDALDGGIEDDVFPSGEVGVEAGAEFEDGGDLTVCVYYP